MDEETRIEESLAARSRAELWCLSILLGECAGVIYVLGTVTLKVLNLW
ncbi:MAG: hypothetical protein HY718_01885 [Planctomycetes bacterium]|nr:hypothetical protein [Planctomycetota bacterium]